jgi:hypothetical protein
MYLLFAHLTTAQLIIVLMVEVLICGRLLQKLLWYFGRRDDNIDR